MQACSAVNASRPAMDASMHCHGCSCVGFENQPLSVLSLSGCCLHAHDACPQLLPLLGGRHASAHAAAVLELLCAPPASPSAAAAQAGGAGGKDSSGTKDGKKSRAGSAASSKASAGAAGSGADRSLSSVLQQGVLTAGGLPALLKVGQYRRQQPLGPGPARLTHAPHTCSSISLA